MKAWTWIATGLFLGATTASFAQNSPDISLTHHEQLTGFDWSRNGLAVAGPDRNTGDVQLSFVGLGRSFDLQLVSNNRFLSAAALAAMPEGMSVYRGSVNGIAGSWVRITVINDMPRGVIFDGQDLIAIEAPGAAVVASSKPIIYRLADANVAAGTMACGTDNLSGDGSSMFKAMVGELSAVVQQGPGAVSEMTVSTIGDFELAVAMGGNAAAAIIARMNIVDGIYSQQLGVQLAVQTPEVFTGSNDPFTDTAIANELLDDLATYRFDTLAHYSHGLTHLFTGRELDTPTVGIAYGGATGGAICSRFFGAGLTQSDHGEMFDALIVAHEIGHNFGAPHDGQAGSPCVTEPQTFIMAPSVTGNDQFSACSIMQMQDDIANAACINLLPSVDMTVTLRGPAPVVLLGNRVVFEFDVTNRGTITATNVMADITLPNNVSIQSSATTAGMCADGAGSVICDLGAVAGLDSAVITVTSNATAVGSDMVDAVLTTDVDDVPGNNQETVQVVVDPAVDLIVTAPGATQLTVDQSRTVSASLGNQSTLGATNVVLGITLDAGLRADSASWPLGTCSVTDQQVDCQAASFDAQSTSSIDVTVTGVSTGAQNVSLSISSDEADAYMPDNSASGTVTVNSANGGGDEDDGGGGATGVLSLLAIMAMMIRRRRLRPGVE